MNDVDKFELASGIFIFVSYLVIFIAALRMSRYRVRLTMLYSAVLITALGVLLVLATFIPDYSEIIIGLAYVYYLWSVIVVVILLLLSGIGTIAVWLGIKKIKPDPGEEDDIIE